MLFINTRPVDRAASLTMALEQRAVEVYALPLLELLPRAWDHDLARLYQQLAHTQVIVVVSPSAVQFGMAHLLQSGLTVSDLQHIQWIAVGQKTAQALAEYGWVVSRKLGDGVRCQLYAATRTASQDIAYMQGFASLLAGIVKPV